MIVSGREQKIDAVLRVVVILSKWIEHCRRGVGRKVGGRFTRLVPFQVESKCNNLVADGC